MVCVCVCVRALERESVREIQTKRTTNMCSRLQLQLNNVMVCVCVCARLERECERDK